MTKKKSNIDIPKKEDKFYNHKGEVCYWKGKIMIAGVLVYGKVTKSQMVDFLKVAPKNIDLDKWLFPTDRIQDRLTSAKRKNKANLGL